MSIYIFWIGAGILFLIIEMLFTTFYWLALGIAAFVTWAYAFFTSATVFDIPQALIFLIVGTICSYFLPRILTPDDSHQKPQWLDIYLGEKHKIKKRGEDFVVTLDWVDYLVISDADLRNNDSVELVARKWSIFIVEII